MPIITTADRNRPKIPSASQDDHPPYGHYSLLRVFNFRSMNTSTDSDPLPPPTEIFSSVKSSCHHLRELSGIELSQSAITDFLSSLQESQWSKLSIQHGTKLPLKFDNFLEEITSMTLLELLNFCSGYRITLKRLTGRGAFDTIRSFIIALHISRSDLSPTGLEKVSVEDIATMMQIPVTEDVPHEKVQGVMVEKRNDLWKLVQLVRGVMNETGQILRRAGYKSLGALVVECARRSKVEGKEGMVTALPAFRDMAIINNRPVYLFKKIQLLVMDLHNRFSISNPDLFNFHDITSLPIFSDNVIPTMLHHFDIIPLTPSSDATPEQIQLLNELKEDLRTGRETTRERSYIFRAAAVDACEQIAKTAREIDDSPVWVREMKSVDVDGYLWSVAKVGELREVVRFSDPNTVFF